MKIAVWSYKGGVGKTAIAYSLAVDLDYYLITNDFSNILQNYNKARLKIGSTVAEENTIYDFGGFQDEKAKIITRQCDVILIPTIADANSIMKSIQMVQEFKDKKIIIVANMLESEKDKQDIIKIMTHHFPDIDIAFIRRGKLFKKASEERISPTQLYNKDNLNKHIYATVFKDYLNLLKRFVK